ncbi:Uu.00g012960.m01.CDS01 [Anthostomella pinea]|uniref:Uu.00g012960.m01.CDS01 n=1 Tax=Anthostomella pinea TaxID=933095 RepID=A0AAI8VY23_9PEZI|nr:Uu.00g012960.m01.CDS01 [Anthostomella pinea]
MDISGNALVVGGGTQEFERLPRQLLTSTVVDGSLPTIMHSPECGGRRRRRVQCRGDRFRAEAIQVDITKLDSVRDLVSRMMQIFGRMDYCVNSAGIGVQHATDIASMSLDVFQRFLDINTVGMFLVTREVSVAMRTQEARAVSATSPGRGTTRGSVINLGSGSSLITTPDVLPYTTPKHAALGLSKNSALDNASYGIRVNGVCPSWTDTPMVQKATSGVEGLEDFMKAAVPIARIAMPEEVADAVVFLCSPRSSYVTGCSFIVDGGTTLTALR